MSSANPNLRPRDIPLALAFAVPVWLIFAYIHWFGVNLITRDEWALVPLIDAMRSHRLQVAALFAQHNEHRILFPRLLMLGLASLTRCNTVSWMYASGLLLAATAGLLLYRHMRAHGRSPRALALFVPVVWLVCTLRQAENLLWGWQVSIVLCVFAFVAATVLLDEAAGGLWRFPLAVAFASVSTFSFAAGLAAWPALFASLLLQWVPERGTQKGRRLRALLVLWGLLWGAVWLLYARGYVVVNPQGTARFALRHPGQALYVLLSAIGNVASDDSQAASAAGLTLLLAAGALAWAAWKGRADRKAMEASLPLFLFALAAAVLVALGRSSRSDSPGTYPRYVTLTLLGPVGVYGAVLALKDTRLRLVLGGAMASLFVCICSASLDGCLNRGALWRDMQLGGQATLRSIEHVDDGPVRQLYPDASFVRTQAKVLERYQLNVFAPGALGPAER